MKIKSLVFGSMVAFATVSGAHAADMVKKTDMVIEPEPVGDYVRVCDAYGSGFFYLPGTETCIKFGGYVDVRYGYHSAKIDKNAEKDSTVSGKKTSTTPKLDDKHSKLTYKGRLNVDLRNETDFGLLRSQLRLEGTGSSKGKTEVKIARALVSLDNFNLGYSSSYWQSGHGFGGNDLLNDGYYGGGSALLADYTFAVGGVHITAGLENKVDDDKGEIFKFKELAFYAGAKYSASWGSVAGTYIHNMKTKAGAFKVSGTLSNINESGLSLHGWLLYDRKKKNENDNDYESSGYVEQGLPGIDGFEANNKKYWYPINDKTLVTSSTSDEDRAKVDEASRIGYLTKGKISYIWGASASYELIKDKLKLQGVFSYISGKKQQTTVAAGDFTKANAFSVGLIWTPISGFSIQPQYYQSTFKFHDFSDQKNNGFAVRFVRSW